jgi:hypothetical protein
MKTEPVMVAAAITSIVGAIAAFGLIKDAQVQAIVASIDAVVPLLLGLFARSKVSPVE